MVSKGLNYISKMFTQFSSAQLSIADWKSWHVEDEFVTSIDGYALWRILFELITFLPLYLSTDVHTKE